MAELLKRPTVLKLLLLWGTFGDGCGQPHWIPAMEAKALEFLKTTIEAANDARIVTTDREPRHVYYVLQPDGKLERTEALGAPGASKAADRLQPLTRSPRR